MSNGIGRQVFRRSRQDRQKSKTLDIQPARRKGSLLERREGGTSGALPRLGKSSRYMKEWMIDWRWKGLP